MRWIARKRELLWLILILFGWFILSSPRIGQTLSQLLN